ncbi:MAG TPA: hypothetical protein VNO52_07215 [Methylomirabilota bacterium]|nr:hypothetical protein [Methylomirabilota bacterium]
MAFIEGTVGILPPGALGVAFYYHLTGGLSHDDGDVFFLERPGSVSAKPLREGGELVISAGDHVHRLPARERIRGGVLECHRTHTLPEILLVCPNPDQLLGIITVCVELLERVFEEGGLWGGALPIPIVVLSSNGIYFQRLRQIYIEKIEEATLLGRLPDLWPHLMPQIVGRLLRGVTIQTGVREGSGAATIYHPGPRGITRLAGGDEGSRQRACQILSRRGGWFELAANSSATRLEFDKALVNLTANLLGQLQAIDEHGGFRPLRVEEIVVASQQEEIRRLARAVFRVGQAVRAYGPTEDFEVVFGRMLESLYQHLTHVPSSLQWVDLRLRTGTLKAELTPTEAWLLEPLIRYARSAELEAEAAYFEELRTRLLDRLTRLCARQRRGQR